MYHDGKEGEQHPWQQQEKHCQQIEEDESFPLLSTDECDQFWALQQKRVVDMLKKVQCKITKMIKELKRLS